MLYSGYHKQRLDRWNTTCFKDNKCIENQLTVLIKLTFSMMKTYLKEILILVEFMGIEQMLLPKTAKVVKH